MHRDLYSNSEFNDIKEMLNKEIRRRGTFKWWDPLVTPKIGQDRTSPRSIPDGSTVVDDDTYTINNPSHGSLEPTRNTVYPAHGDNPGGGPRDRNDSNPNTSASAFNSDEMRNYLIGLSKIMDINLFYGRDEKPGTAFRDPKGIEDALKAAQESELNRPLHETTLSPSKMNRDGIWITYPLENGQYVMPSGELDGEETEKWGPDENNFFDDHGASIIDTGEKTIDGQPILISDSNYHPFNPATSPKADRSWNDQNNLREDSRTSQYEGEMPSSQFGPNPRNPQQGNPYKSRPVFGGVLGACGTACTGLCHITCDNECSESCTTTCWGQCGNACTSTCGNLCTGCTTMCYTSCKTKCENTTGYACLKVGAKTVSITAEGEPIGESAVRPRNTISYTTYSCHGCAYTCQFYPNKRTTCWDAACQEMCFTSCYTYCSTSCFGGCIDNDSENTGWKTGIGRGCSGGCTANCIGICEGVCQGVCVQACFHACEQLCSDNCAWLCETNCGSGCANACRNYCVGCDYTCTGHCKGASQANQCVGCSWAAGCTSACKHNCDTNCIGWGCRSVCGIDNSGSCEANCRISCVSVTCSSMCGQACSSQCTTCVNNCGIQCGPCTSQCSVGCGADCNITCSERCQHSCDLNCTTSCTEECAGCSNLCYSCVGMCIGACSVKCEYSCSSCSHLCGWWCDSTCGRGCFSNCVDRCINSCSGSCATYVGSNTTSKLAGPERPPTAEGYHTPNPSNRIEEQESFILHSLSLSHLPLPPAEPKKEYPIVIEIDRYGDIQVKLPDGLTRIVKSCSTIGGVYRVDEETGAIIIDNDMLPGMIESMKPNTNVDHTDSIFAIIIPYNPEVPVTKDMIEVKRLPFGLEYIGPIKDANNNVIIIITKIDWNFRVDDPLRLE